MAKNITQEKRLSSEILNDGLENIMPLLQNFVRATTSNVIHQVREQLEEFITFIEEIEISCDIPEESLQKTDKEQSSSPSRRSSLNQMPICSSMPAILGLESTHSTALSSNVCPDNNAMQDAFKLVRDLFHRMTNLISAVPKVRPNDHLTVCGSLECKTSLPVSPRNDAYYTQYVFQITFYLLQIIIKELEKFSDTLCQATIPEESHEIFRQMLLRPCSSEDSYKMKSVGTQTESPFEISKECNEVSEDSARILLRETGPVTTISIIKPTSKIRTTFRDAMEILNIIYDNVFSHLFEKLPKDKSSKEISTVPTSDRNRGLLPPFILKAIFFSPQAQNMHKEDRIIEKSTEDGDLAEEDLGSQKNGESDVSPQLGVSNKLHVKPNLFPASDTELHTGNSILKSPATTPKQTKPFPKLDPKLKRRRCTSPALDVSRDYEGLKSSVASIENSRQSHPLDTAANLKSVTKLYNSSSSCTSPNSASEGLPNYRWLSSDESGEKAFYSENGASSDSTGFLWNTAWEYAPNKRSVNTVEDSTTDDRKLNDMKFGGLFTNEINRDISDDSERQDFKCTTKRSNSLSEEIKYSENEPACNNEAFQRPPSHSVDVGKFLCSPEEKSIASDTKGLYIQPNIKSPPAFCDQSKHQEMYSDVSPADASPKLVIDIRKFTTCVKTKFQELLSAKSTQDENNDILHLLVECFNHATQLFLGDEKTDKINGSQDEVEAQPLDEKEAPQKEFPRADDTLSDEIKNFALDTMEKALNILKQRRDSVELARHKLAKVSKSGSSEEAIENSQVKFNLQKTAEIYFKNKTCDSCDQSFVLANINKLSNTTLTDDVVTSLKRHESYLQELKSHLSQQNIDEDIKQPCILHVDHDELDPNKLEVREINQNGDFCVYTEIWDPDDEEFWSEKGMLESGPQVHIVQHAGEIKDPMVQVVFDPQIKVLKPAPAHTEFKHIKLEYPGSQFGGVPNVLKQSPKSKLTDPASWPLLTTDQKDLEAARKVPPLPKKVDIYNKLWTFFDDLQKVGYGRGPPLVIKIRRWHFLKDSFDVFMTPSRIPLRYYRAIRVIFTDEAEKKDRTPVLFQLLSENLFGTKYLCLFDYTSKEAPILHLNPASPSHLRWFQFAGIVLGLSILYQKRLGVMLPICFYKALLNRPLLMEDVAEVDSLLYEKLCWLRDNEIQLDDKRFNYTVKEKFGALTYDYDLISNGSNTPVTEANKYDYIERVVKWKLAERFLIHLKEVRRGLETVLHPHLLARFTYEELQAIVAKRPLLESPRIDIEQRCGSW